MLIQRNGAGGFILSEAPGLLSRDNATLASGQTCQAGTVLMDNGSGKLVIHDGSTEPAEGVLYAYADASGGDVAVVIVARQAEVSFALLSGLPEDDEARGNVFAALEAIGIRERPTQDLSAGSGGGGDYHADAVHFSGTGTYLDIASLACTNGTSFSYSGWFLSDWVNDMVAFISDPDGAYINYLGAASAGDITNNVGSGSFSTAVNYMGLGGVSWHHILFTMITDPSTIIKLAIDGAIVDPTVPFNNAATFIFNTKPFAVGDDTFDDNYIGDMADLRIMPNVSLLTAGELTPETIALFIDGDGKPVDPAVATAALGAPCMLFSGDATGFAVNQGTGGVFTLHGSLTNASTSPSD